MSQSSYRQIFKATGLFGGVQVFNILISVVRSKFIAVLLGPTGVGIMGLLTSTTGLITGLTNFGLGTSSVRNVAEAHAQGDGRKIGIVVSTLRRLVWITGILGAFITLIFAPWLSELTFETKDYTYAFMFLSITLLFAQLSVGQNVVLQGTRKLKYLAKANVLGSLLGLIITVPLYYFFRLDGIVPAIIIASLFTLALSWYFSRKVPIEKIRLSFGDLCKEGKGMLRMGFMLSLSGLIAMGGSYLTRIYIRSEGGVDEVGLYNAGFAIIVTYAGLVFNAMATDYYPRLSGVAHDNKLARHTINQQAEIAILILAPVLMIFFVFIKRVVQILYSNEFMPVTGMIQWAALGMFFRAAVFPVGYLFLAKGASSVFLASELLSSFYVLLFNIWLYKVFGITGMGIAFLMTYIIGLLQVFLIAKIKYLFTFSRSFIRLFLMQLFCAIGCFCVMRFMEAPYHYIAGSGLIGLSVVYSLKGLNKRMELKKLIFSKLRKR
jgi:O-antigen/teichoic acid export membrane protein